MNLIRTLALACLALLGLVHSGHAEKRITFVFVSDIYQMSAQNGRGGYARIAAAIKAERARGGKVIVAHAGDAISPCLMCSFDRGAHVTDIMNRIGFDIFVPGNHEYDFGKEIFLKRMAEMKGPVYAANLRSADGQAIPGIRENDIIEVEGIKLGIVGLTAQDSPEKSNPGDLRIAPVQDTLAAKAKALRARGAEFIVAVVHAERPIDTAIYERGLADVILSGDDHDIRFLYNRRTAFVEGGEDGLYVLALDIAFEPRTDPAQRLEWKPHFRMIDTADLTPDPAIAARVKYYEDQLSAELDVEIATLGAPLDSRSAVVRGGEAAWGNLITDAIRDVTGADLAVMNGGGIRGGRRYEAGHKLTRRNVLAELPFSNKTLIFRLTGAEILKTLEHGYASYPRPNGPFLQLSGAKVVIDGDRPEGQKVLSVEIGGAPLEKDKYYTVAASDFFLRGGDGFTAFTQSALRTRVEDAQLIANDVMVYARKLGTVAARPEGRITAR